VWSFGAADGILRLSRRTKRAVSRKFLFSRPLAFLTYSKLTGKRRIAAPRADGAGETQIPSRSLSEDFGFLGEPVGLSFCFFALEGNFGI
jgi:hypothetical protein